ncbi:MAG: thymidylate kinase, partial [Edaphobacter sp.]
TRLYIRTLLRLTPKPEAAFVLDATPEIAFARKPEYPLEFLHSNRNAYLDLARLAGMIVISPSTIDQAHAEVLGTVLRKRDALAPINRQTGQPLDTI